MTAAGASIFCAAMDNAARYQVKVGGKVVRMSRYLPNAYRYFDEVSGNVELVDTKTGKILKAK